MQVCPRHTRRRLRWRRGSLTIAGLCTNCCRFMCRCLAGCHPSHVGVPHRRSNASSSNGVGTTVSCGATHRTGPPIKNPETSRVLIFSPCSHSPTSETPVSARGLLSFVYSQHDSPHLSG